MNEIEALVGLRIDARWSEVMVGGEEGKEEENKGMTTWVAFELRKISPPLY